MSKALGKGLSALITEKNTDLVDGSVSHIQTDKIKNNTLQPRVNYDSDRLNELKSSIKEKGILQPILVREKDNEYEVVAGERRLRAARELGLEEVPAIIKSLSDQDALVIALVENIQREELNPIEEAQAFRKLIEDFQYTQENVAESVGKNRSTITNLLRLLKLPKEVQKAISDGLLSVGHARAILSADSSSEQKALMAETIKKGLSVRELERLIKRSSQESAPRKKSAKQENPAMKKVAEGMQKLLGTKVSIDPQKKGGRIVIEFYNNEELNRIVKHIIK